MSVETTIEPTADQLSTIAALERRAAAAFRELDQVVTATKQLARDGIAAAEDFEVGVDAADTRQTLQNLRGLRVTGGRAGFADWWYYRVDSGSPFGELLDDQFPAGPVRQRFIAVELAVAAKDPALIEAMNAAASETYIHDEDEFARLAGMRRAMVKDRAEAAISQLIEAGWRP